MPKRKHDYTRISINVPTKQARILQAYTRKKDITITSLFRVMLREYLLDNQDAIRGALTSPE